MSIRGGPHRTGKGELEHKREQNRVLGRLALGAAEEEIPAGTCPSSEALARFIEQGSRIEGTERSNMLNHLAHCEKCYEEWTTLSSTLEADGEKRGAAKLWQLFSTPRYLTAVGSGLAVAAGIVVFLSISPRQLKDSAVVAEKASDGRPAITALEQAAPEPTVAQTYDMVPGKAETQPSSGDRYGGSSPAPAAVPVGEGEAQSGAFSLMEREAKEMAGLGLEEKSRLKKHKTVAAGKRSEREATGYAGFLEQLSFVCMEREAAGQADAGILLDQGRQLLLFPEKLTPEQVKLVKMVVKVLEEPADVDGKPFCDRLADIVGDGVEK